MSEPPPAYQPNPSPWAYDPTKDQPASNPGYPPPPQFVVGYAQPPQAFMTQPQPGMVPIVVAAISFGEDPQSMTCPHCQNQIMTGVRPRNGLLSWLICGGLTLFGCWICCFIPFCCRRCQDMEHYCPRCAHLLGTYRRI